VAINISQSNQCDAMTLVHTCVVFAVDRTKLTPVIPMPQKASSTMLPTNRYLRCLAQFSK